MFVLLTADSLPIPVQIPIEVLSFGSIMLVTIVLIHGAGLDRIIARHRRKAEELRRKSWHPYLATYIFAGAILFMLFLHVFEICVWGVALRGTGLIGNLRDAMYFSANTYTTIGYGQMDLPYSWRELSPLMAISGLFAFAWTTGEMFNIVGSHRKLVEDLATLRNQKKSAMKERESTQPQKLTEEPTSEAQDPQAEAGLTREQRRALRDEIETKLKQLHDAERAEIESFRRNQN